jgi:hypothetical protein
VGELVVFEIPGEFDALTALKDHLLTDGFGEYRKKLGAESQAWKELRVSVGEDAQGAYLAEDRDYLRTLVASARLDGKAVTFGIDDKSGETACRECLGTLPFDNKPLPAVQFVLAELSQGLLAGPNPNTVPVPLPCALAKIPAAVDGRKTVADLVQKAIERALEELKLEGTAPIPVLQTILRGRDWSKLCLVAYAAESTQIDYEQQRAVLAKLKQRLQQDRAPATFFLASDLHHAQFIEATWKGGGE